MALSRSRPALHNSVDVWSVVVIILLAVSKACISNKRPHRFRLSGESSAGFGTILWVGGRWLKGLAFDAFTRPLQLITTCYLITKLLSSTWLLVIIYHYFKESESRRPTTLGQHLARFRLQDRSAVVRVIFAWLVLILLLPYYLRASRKLASDGLPVFKISHNREKVASRSTEAGAFL